MKRNILSAGMIAVFTIILSNETCGAMAYDPVVTNRHDPLQQAVLEQPINMRQIEKLIAETTFNELKMSMNTMSNDVFELLITTFKKQYFDHFPLWKIITSLPQQKIEYILKNSTHMDIIAGFLKAVFCPENPQHIMKIYDLDFCKIFQDVTFERLSAIYLKCNHYSFTSFLKFLNKNIQDLYDYGNKLNQADSAIPEQSLVVMEAIIMHERMQNIYHGSV